MKLIRIIFVVLVACACGCSGTYKQEVKFNAFEPLRVAVLPFAEVDDKGNFIDKSSGLLIDNVAVVSQDLGEQPRTLVRRFVQKELDGTALDTLSPSLVNAKLMHSGFSDEKLNYDYSKLFNTPASQICPKVLDCDAVLYGKVTRWDRSYYAIQSVTTVGIDLKLVSAKDGKVLFSSQAEDSDSRGITKIPTGFSSLVIEPIRGLDNDITVQLAEKVAKKMIDPLRTSNRPEYVNSSPPSIFASAHDGMVGSMTKGDHLTVLLLGSPKNTATFSIGNAITNVPMAERDSGHYVGEFIPVKTDKFAGESVVVSLTDEFGRTTQQKVGGEISLQ